MKTRVIAFTFASCIFSLSAVPQKQISLALVDTSGCDAYVYQPMIDIMHSVGFKVSYKPLYTVMSEPLELARYDAVFFLLSYEFLKGKSSGHLWAKIVRELYLYARRKGKLTGLFFPSIATLAPSANIVDALMPIFQTLGVGLVRLPWIESIFSSVSMAQYSPSINYFMQVTNAFLANTLESRPLRFHTTLNMPHGGTSFDNEALQNDVDQHTQGLYLLPKDTNCSAVVRQTLPYGVYWFNPLYKNHVLISSMTVLTFAGVTENFHFCPLESALRHEMLAMAQRMFANVAQMTNPQVPNRDLKLPASATIVGLAEHDRIFKTAWMELSVFDVSECKMPDEIQQRRAQQDALIKYIFDACLDALWITFNPHMVYSPIGRLKNKEDSWLAAIGSFTQKLNDYATTNKCVPPKIFVGFEITNNLYEPNMPKNYPIDVYENYYADLPLPTSKPFWTQEIVTPLEKFVEAWKRPEIGHGINLAGVVFDLEMYCRKTSNLFLNTMTIDAETFNTFAQQKKGVVKIDAGVRDRVLALMEQGVAQRYWGFLENRARLIGSYLRSKCSACIPHCQFMCYVPNLQISWFYKGLYQGLSQTQSPLHLLTFNNEFFAHAPWFKKHKINAHHSTVLMLAKIASEDDFSRVSMLGAHHHGIWFNRFSRFVEPKSSGWVSIEQPGIAESSYPAFMKYLHAH